VALAVVLGANGFIGRHVAAALIGQRDVEVVGSGLGTPLPGLERGWLDMDLLAGDGRLEAELRAARPEFVVNCTGATAGTAAELVRLNVDTTAAILDAIAQSGTGARLIHLGSAAEYGPGPAGLAVAETALAQPVSAYGLAKLAATELVTAAAAAGRDAAVLRVFNALGPGMPPGTLPGGALGRLTEAVAASSPRIEMGPLDSVRDFVDVRDIGAAVVAACLTTRLDSPIVNVGAGTGHTARELVVALAERVGFRGEIGEAAAGSPRSSDVPWQVADVSLAARVLNWRAVYDLGSTVESMTASRT
jgi:nucleoside-diphosphate-sugar epimerase